MESKELKYYNVNIYCHEYFRDGIIEENVELYSTLEDLPDDVDDYVIDTYGKEFFDNATEYGPLKFEINSTEEDLEEDLNRNNIKTLHDKLNKNIDVFYNMEMHSSFIDGKDATEKDKEVYREACKEFTDIESKIEAQGAYFDPEYMDETDINPTYFVYNVQESDIIDLAQRLFQEDILRLTFKKDGTFLAERINVKTEKVVERGTKILTDINKSSFNGWTILDGMTFTFDIYGNGSKEEFRNLTEEENKCLTNDSDSLDLDEELGIDWNDVEEVSDNDRQFSVELFKFISELIPEEDLNESFRSHESLVKHFNKHCLCGNNSKESKKTNVLYDFSTLEQYDNYEREISSGLASGENVIVVNDLTQKEFIEKSFRKFFEGNMYIYFSPLCGFNNNGKSISILFHAYSTSHTSDYKSNTVDMNVRIGETTLTLYPLDSFYLESKLNNIIKKYSPVSIKLKINNENLNESSEESIEKHDELIYKVAEKLKTNINSFEDELITLSQIEGVDVEEIKQREPMQIAKALVEEGIVDFRMLEDIEKEYYYNYDVLCDIYYKGGVIHRDEEAYAKSYEDLCQQVRDNWEYEDDLDEVEEYGSIEIKVNYTDDPAFKGTGLYSKESDDDLEEDIEKHDKLNPVLFEDNKLKPEIKEAIEKIANEFVDGLKEDGVKFTLKDIVLLGSNCSYNYTKDSDLDIHLIADSSDLHCPDELYPLLYSAYRSMFNKNYDITIKGIPAEIYVEMDEPQAKSNGIYSLSTGWIKEPVQQDIPDLDEEEFDKSFSEWENKYFDLLSEIDEGSLVKDKSEVTDKTA